jgi:gas vesicle protein
MTESVEVTLARLEERIKTLSDEVRHVHEEVSDLKAQANRWKGAFWLMVAIGGVVGSLAHLFVGWVR